MAAAPVGVNSSGISGALLGSAGVGVAAADALVGVSTMWQPTTSPIISTPLQAMAKL